VHVWFIAHQAKLQRDATGNLPVPTLYDISGSAHWTNKADIGFVVWRDTADVTTPVQVHVKKVRLKRVGKTGVAELVYDRVTGRYTDLGPLPQLGKNPYD
jgi:twinkle protein